MVSLDGTSLTWSDQTAPRLRPLQLLTPRLRPFQLLLPDCILFSCCCSSASARCHTHAVQSIIRLLQITSLCMLLNIIFVHWVSILSSNKGPFAITCSKSKEWVYFRGWMYFREATVHVIYNVYSCMSNGNENPITETALRNDYGLGYEYTKQHC